MSDQQIIKYSLAPEGTQNVFKGQLEDVLQPLHSVNSGISSIGIQLKERSAFAGIKSAWDDLEKRARDLHHEHANNANTLSSSLDLFSSNTLPMLIRNAGDSDPGLWIEKLNELVKSILPNQEVVGDLYTEYENIQKSVVDFGSTLDKFKVDTENKVEGLNHQLEELRIKKKDAYKKWSDCNASIGTVQKRINQLIIEKEELNHSDDPSDKELLDKVEAELAEKESERQLLKDESSNLYNTITALETEITQKYAELRIAQADQSTAGAIQVTAEKVAHTIPSIVQNITVFYSIYQGFDNDVDLLKPYIRDPSKVPTVVKIYNQRQRVYDIISEGLTDWATSVGPF